MGLKITGIGHYLPPKVETAKELSDKINKSENWIISRTGVKERRVSLIDVDLMAANAASVALGGKGPPDLILNASGVGKQIIPDTSVFIQRELNMSGVPSFSIHATCLSFLVALKVANDFLSSGSYKRILIVSSDRGTVGRNFNEPESSSLLGDGAASVVVENDPENKSMLIDWRFETWPEGAEFTQVKGGGTNLHPDNPKTTKADNYFSMSGPRVYRMARKKVHLMIKDILASNNTSLDEVDMVVPHQASNFAVQAYASYGGFDESKVVNVIEEMGNCVAASLPLALAVSIERKKIKRGMKILLVGTGAGLSNAAALIKF